jgi:hypothetical protein
MRSKVLTVVVLAIAIQGPPSAVSAHERSQEHRWTDSAWCVDDKSTITDPENNDGVSIGLARTYKGDCSTAINRDIEFINARLLIWYYRESTSKPQLCAYTDFYKNPKVAWAFQLTVKYPARPWCGAGYYETEAGGWLWYDGHWHGGYVLSGKHYLNV